MTPRRILETYRNAVFQDVDGFEYELELLPGLSDPEIDAFEQQQPGDLAPDIRELLAFASGIHSPVFDEIDFRGRNAFAFEDVFPAGIPIASDGTGNFAVVDVDRHSGEWGAILFACHDPPVITYIADDLAGFLQATLTFHEDARQDAPNPLRVAMDDAMKVWHEDPYMMTLDEARNADDDALRDFAERLEPPFEICDLRRAEAGQGLSWGRNGPDTNVIRHEQLRLFAVQQRKKGLLARLFGF